MPGYANPQNLNRYSYVTNNPLRYTDPTGHMLDYGSNEGGGGFLVPSPPKPPTLPVDPGNDDEDDDDPEPLLDPTPDNNGDDCMEYGSQTTCEVNVPSSSLPGLSNYLTGAQVITFLGYTATGLLVGAAGGSFIPGGGTLAGAIIGGVIFGGIGYYESLVLSDIEEEFEAAANNTLIVAQPPDENTYGVVVDGNNDGIGTLVNTPAAYLTLTHLLSLYTP